MTTETPAAKAISSIFHAAVGPPTRAGLTTSTSAALAASSSRAAATDDIDSSAAIATGEPSRTAARSDGSSAATGCSTYSIRYGATAARRSRAVATSHAPFASSRRRTSVPAAARTAATRSISSTVVRSGPTFILIVPNPAETAARAAAAVSLAPRNPMVALTGTDRGPPAWGLACSVESSTAESSAHRSARPPAPAASSSAPDGNPLPARTRSTVSRTSRASSAATAGPASKSSAASPSPTTPSASKSRKIHDSRWRHAPAAVTTGRRNGTRTRIASAATTAAPSPLTRRS